MAAAPSPANTFGLRSARQALLVIHGIGEQNPYETLDSFSRGVLNYLSQARHLNTRLCPIEIAHKDWTQVGMRIGVFPPGHGLPECPVKDQPMNPDQQPAVYVDIFEYYWAPETEDKLSAIETVKWVLKTDFTPLRYFADNLQEMISLYRLSVHRAVWRALELSGRELLRVFLLYFWLAFGAGLLLEWISRPHDWGTALQPLAVALLPYLTLTHSLILVLYGGFLLMAWFAVQSLIELSQHPGRPIQPTPEKISLALDIVLAAAFLTLALAWDFHSENRVLEHLWNIVTRDGRWQPLVGATLSALASYALTAYVADIAVYTNIDAKSKSYAARNAILNGSSAALKYLLTCGDYGRVILAGHSLGSVIAYDTINELLAQYNAAPGPGVDRPDPNVTLEQLHTLKGLVTFGSPLDKVYYFFREHVRRDQSIRAQILSMLHSFRKLPSGRDYGIFDFNYAFRQLDSCPEPFLWLNAWSRLDPVSAELKFYFVNDQREFHYAVPVLAHLSYWSDPAFYDYLGAGLLF